MVNWPCNVIFQPRNVPEKIETFYNACVWDFCISLLISLLIARGHGDKSQKIESERKADLG